MKTIQIERCVHCMGDMRDSNGADICPICNKNPLEVDQPAYCLRPFSVLRGKYLVGRMLGRGGFGITYVGWDLLLETKVAIKECYPGSLAVRDSSVSNLLQWDTSLTRDDQWRASCESFLREARKMAKVRGVSEVVRVLDTFEENNTAYIVMDFIEGITLKQWLEENGTLTPDECIRRLWPLMSALSRIHQQGIIHRDISPDNIMIEPNGGLKLLDLGAAKELVQGENHHSLLVTKSGFSPMEQYAESGQIGAWTDVYAMCATIYYCMTGRMVPSAPDRVDNDPLSFPPEAFKEPLPDGMEASLRGGLAMRIEDRIQSISELANRLDGNSEDDDEEENEKSERDDDNGQSDGLESGVIDNETETTDTGNDGPHDPIKEVELKKPEPKQKNLIKKVSTVAAVLLVCVVTAAFWFGTRTKHVEKEVYTYAAGGSGVYTGDWRGGCPNGYGTMIITKEVALTNGQALPVGTTYTVDNWKNGQLNGQGTAAYTDGSVYDGEWVDGVRSGLGTYTWADGSIYIGEWKNDNREGQGIKTFSDNSQYAGDQYEGEWKDGMYNGQGTYTWADGRQYVGEWKDDKKEGQGTFTWDSGQYIGEWKDDKRNGQGTYTWANGDKYEGEWKDGKRNGQGIKTFGDNSQYAGDQYEGEWKDGMYNGQGTYTWADGRQYVGDRKHDKKERQGPFTWDSGQYIGEWKDDKRNGQGTETYDGDGKYEGEWKDNEFNGQGIRIWADGSKYVGSYKDSRRDGQGVFYNADGSIGQSGTWENGKFVSN